MSGIVNVVVTCTKKKTHAIAERLQLRSVSGNTVQTRVRRWTERLRRMPVDTVTVRELYSGDHWSIARDLDSLSTAKRKLNVWVVSAGYGLVRLDDAIKPYSVTFSRRHPDSVVPHSDFGSLSSASSEWWTELTAARLGRGKPRCLADLVSESPQAPLLVVASETYLVAVREDLARAARQLEDSALLSIISAGTRSLDGLTGNLVPCDARLQSTVGGVRRSLNVRLARLALEGSRRSRPTLPLLRKRFTQLLATAPELMKYDRQPMGDGEVIKFIEASLKDDPTACHTPLLRNLRASGRACEQTRFRSLFQSVCTFWDLISSCDKLGECFEEHLDFPFRAPGAGKLRK